MKPIRCGNARYVMQTRVLSFSKRRACLWRCFACCADGTYFVCLFCFFGPQGLELVNPNADKEKKVMQANKKWFDSSSGFMSAKPT